MRKVSAAKRVGLEPSVTLRVMCRTKTSICTAEREECPGIVTEREEPNGFHLDKKPQVGAGALVQVWPVEGLAADICATFFCATGEQGVKSRTGVRLISTPCALRLVWSVGSVIRADVCKHVNM